MKRSKTTNKKWFKRVRWSYLPNNWAGTLVYGAMLLFLTVVFIIIHHQNRAWLDTAILYAPYLVCTGVVMTWIASHKS